MYTPQEHKEYSDYLRSLGVEKQSDIDAVLDYIYSLAAIAVDVTLNNEKQNRHP